MTGEELIKDIIWVMIMTVVFTILFSKHGKKKWKAALFYLFVLGATKFLVTLVLDYFKLFK